MTGDILKERATLFLGSRLKRLAERMQGDVVVLAEGAGLAIQPSQYPLLATLDCYGPQTIGELTTAMELSQPTITRSVSRLVEMGLVDVSRVHRDQRHKTISLTAEGEAALVRSRGEVWPQVEAAVNDLLQGLEGPLLDQITAIEDRLSEISLSQRAKAHAQHTPGLKILEFTDDLAGAFRDINAQWISDMYRLEQTDRDVLDNPRARIIDPGGAILFVEAQGLGVVGACALQKTGEGRFELTKMGVLESARGRKGRRAPAPRRDRAGAGDGRAGPLSPQQQKVGGGRSTSTRRPASSTTPGSWPTTAPAMSAATWPCSTWEAMQPRVAARRPASSRS